MSGAGRDGADVTNHLGDGRFADDDHGEQMSDGDTGRLEKLDISSFPALNNANHLPKFGLKLNLADGLWSPSNSKHLLAGFSGLGGFQILPIAGTRGTRRHTYLSNNVPKNLVETEAGKLWAGLEKPKSQIIARCEMCDSAGTQENSLPGTKCKKMGGKKQWQPLNL